MILGIANAARETGRKREYEAMGDVLQGLAFPGQAVRAGGSSMVAPLQVTTAMTGEAANSLINSLTIAQTPNQVARILSGYLGIPEEQLAAQFGPAQGPAVTGAGAGLGYQTLGKP
jgi:hypothetical protein